MGDLSSFLRIDAPGRRQRYTDMNRFKAGLPKARTTAPPPRWRMALVRPLHRTQASFARLQWLFPIAITAHNIEEATWLPGFVTAHRTELPWMVAPFEFRFALVLLTVDRKSTRLNSSHLG